MTRNDVFFSLDEIEKDFDKSMINLDQILISNNLISSKPSEETKSSEPENSTRSSLSTLSSSFATLFQYTLTLAELNAKLEAEVLDSRNRAVEAAATIESHGRIEDDLVLQLHSAKCEGGASITSSLQIKNITKTSITSKSKPQEIVPSRSTDSKSSVKSLNDDIKEVALNSLKEQIDKRRAEIRADEHVVAERDRLKTENEGLRDLLAKNTHDLYAARLTSKYLDKELAGRIQQIQLIGKGKMSAENFGKLWTQLESEIFLHRQKTLIQACRANHLQKQGSVEENLAKQSSGTLSDENDPNQKNGRDDHNAGDDGKNDNKNISNNSLSEKSKTGSSSVEPGQDEGQTLNFENSSNNNSTPTEALPKETKIPGKEIREVHFLKTENNVLGMSITGGHELGVPIIISDLKEGGVAEQTKQLVIGDAILSINGMSLKGLNHTEAAAVLSNASGEICLEVQFLMVE